VFLIKVIPLPWYFTKEGEALAESLAKKCNLPLLKLA